MGSESINNVTLNMHFKEGTVVGIALVPDDDVPKRLFKILLELSNKCDKQE